MVDKIGISFLVVVFASCAASLPYGTDYPLSNSIVHSRDGVLSCSIPQGWFSSTEDSLGTKLTIFLMNDDITATLVVKELKLDPLSLQQVELQGLKLLARLSASFHSEDSRIVLPELQEFELRGNKFCSYELSQGENRARVVVFSAKGRYYECEARASHNNWTGEQYTRMFKAQQSLLASLHF